MSVVNSTPLLAAAGGEYQISRSVRLRSSASAYLNRTPASAGNRKTWTWSGWVKRGTLGVDNNSLIGIDSPNANESIDAFALRFLSSDVLRVFISNSSGTSVILADTTAVFRDPSAWYHVVMALDTTQATNSNGVKLYVNGVQQALSFTAYTQNYESYFNSTQPQYIGRSVSNIYFDGYLTEVNFIDGQALTPSSFGETDVLTGVWKPKKYTGTYGTNGFYLNFSDPSAATAAAIGKDSSGNGNNWTPNNISVTAGVTYDSMIDVPTPYADGGNGRGNYATLNPISPTPFGSLTEGNQRWGGGGDWGGSKSTIAIPPDGKWYAELTTGFTTSNTQQIDFGIQPGNISNGYILTKQYSFGLNNGFFLVVNGSYSTNRGGTTPAGTVLQVAVDAASGKIWLGVNNAWYDTYNTTNGNPSNDTNPTATGISFTADEFHIFVKTVNQFAHINFGQRPFAYTPPTGFKALNTGNLPAPVIAKGGEHFNAVLWTGDNANPRTISGVGFQPDFTWTKVRSNAGNPRLNDSVRGSARVLFSNTTDAELTTDADGTISAFTSDGFTLQGSSSTQNVNLSPRTYVAWNWKANGAGVTNTAGSITSTVSANPTAGFSVVTFTGNGSNPATVGHGLGAAPRFIIFKRTNASVNWFVYAGAAGNGAFEGLNTNSAYNNGLGIFNSTAPTSTVFSLGNTDGNASGGTYVAYCFSEVAGYSRFGSYVGNGNANGPFIYLGFRPRYIMLKNTSRTNTRWIVMDTARDAANVAIRVLSPNGNTAEDASTTYWLADFLSNGIKLRYGADSEFNQSGDTYIFAAFAEHPFQNALAR
jgi:hypothetical protein